jgi:hypothetical protein
MKIKKLGSKLYYVLTFLDNQLYKDVNISSSIFPYLTKYYNSEQVSLNIIAYDINDIVRNQFWNDYNE